MLEEVILERTHMGMLDTACVLYHPGLLLPPQLVIFPPSRVPQVGFGVPHLSVVKRVWYTS